MSGIPIEAGPAPQRKGRVETFLTEIGDLAYFLVDGLRALPTVPKYASEVFRQTSILIRGSTLVIGALVMFIGVTQVNFAYFFLRSAGASDYTGLFSGLTTARAAVPIMFGYIFAAKVGGGLAAEIGAMRISEEIDAVEAEGLNPMSYLVGTRLLGALLFVPLAVIVALLAGTLGSWIQAIPVLEGISPSSFFHYHWGSQNLLDQFLAFINLGTQAIVIVLVSCYYGYKAQGGPTGVGAAVARSLLVNIVLVHVITAMYILVFYGQDVRLPIGG